MKQSTRIKIEIIILFLLLNIFIYCCIIINKYKPIDLWFITDDHICPKTYIFDTYDSMGAMSSCIIRAMKRTGQTNILEYFNLKTSLFDIPRVLDYEVQESIFNDSLFSPAGFRNKGVTIGLLDTWENPIKITLTTNYNGGIGITMQSFGKNGINDNGNGDDIVIWFNTDMSSPELRKKFNK